MSREIKFRIWQTLWKDKELQIIHPVTSIDFDKKVYFVSTSAAGYSFKDAILMQYTGLKDKNGVDIYEGDILKCQWLAELGITEIDCEANAIVKWDEQNPCFHANLIKPYSAGVGHEMTYEETDLPIYNHEFNDNYTFEVIGNIHQNPELLK